MQTILDDTEKAPARDPADLASELASELRDGPQPGYRPNVGGKKRGAHPKGCKCGNCKWSRGPQTEDAKPNAEQEAVKNFHLDPDVLTPGIYGVGKRLTEHFKVTPYQREEARDISRALAYCIEFLIKLWGMNPAFAPFALLAILVVVQVGGRAVEYNIMNDDSEPRQEPQAPIAITP